MRAAEQLPQSTRAGAYSRAGSVPEYRDVEACRSDDDTAAPRHSRRTGHVGCCGTPCGAVGAVLAALVLCGVVACLVLGARGDADVGMPCSVAEAHVPTGAALLRVPAAGTLGRSERLWRRGGVADVRWWCLYTDGTARHGACDGARSHDAQAPVCTLRVSVADAGGMYAELALPGVAAPLDESCPATDHTDTQQNARRAELCTVSVCTGAAYPDRRQ